MAQPPTQHQLLDFSNALFGRDIATLSTLLSQEPALAIAPIGSALQELSGLYFGKQDTALMIAAERGDLDSAQVLLPYSQVGACDHDGSTVLMKAAAGGNAALVQLVLPQSERGALDSEERNPLMIAAMHGRLDCVRLLLPLYPNPHAVSASGQTALMLAATARQGSFECTQLLLPLGDALETDAEGYSALMLCVVEGNLKTAKLLLPHSDVSARNVRGATVLHLAAENRATMVKLLLNVCDPHVLNNEGLTPLMVAASWGVTASLLALLPKSDATLKNREGHTSFDLACVHGKWSNAEALARHLPFALFMAGWSRASPTAQDKLAQTLAFMEQEQLRNALAATGSGDNTSMEKALASVSSPANPSSATAPELTPSAFAQESTVDSYTLSPSSRRRRL